MPRPLTVILILGAWAVSMVALLTRDVLPKWLAGEPPDIGEIALAPDRPRVTRWKVAFAPQGPAAAETLDPDQLDVLGELETRHEILDDNTRLLASRVAINAEKVLARLPFAKALAPPPDSQSESDPANPNPNPNANANAPQPSELASLVIHTDSQADADGQLLQFESRVTNGAGSLVFARVKGVRVGGSLEITIHDGSDGPPVRQRVPYTSGAGTQNALSPFDRLDGLKIGQVWKSQVVNPLTSSVQTASVTVPRAETIRWNGADVPALLMVAEMKPLVARTWVRAEDGLVLRQEVPIPLMRMILERLPDPDDPPATPRRE